jgi:ribosomal protein L37AE/L43A
MSTVIQAPCCSRCSKAFFRIVLKPDTVPIFHCYDCKITMKNGHYTHFAPLRKVG